MFKQEKYIESHSPEMRQIENRVFMAAPTEATILIQGESGTGKELIAKLIHSHSRVKSGPFVAVNCASLQESLFESDLFGHEKGAFTGAIKRRKGKFELAHCGTLLLDEIAEMPSHLQAKLLRAIQENWIDLIGGEKPVYTSVRLIATTNKNISQAMREGSFRKDLFYRISEVSFYLPPLRKRPEDILRFSEHFLSMYSKDEGDGPSINKEARDILQSYLWPGNVRELKNVIRRATIFGNGNEIGPELISLDLEKELELIEEASPFDLKEMERRLVFKALERAEGNKTVAARLLGVSYKTINNKLRAYKKEPSKGIRVEENILRPGMTAHEAVTRLFMLTLEKHGWNITKAAKRLGVKRGVVSKFLKKGEGFRVRPEPKLIKLPDREECPVGCLYEPCNHGSNRRTGNGNT